MPGKHPIISVMQIVAMDLRRNRNYCRMRRKIITEPITTIINNLTTAVSLPTKTDSWECRHSARLYNARESLTQSRRGSPGHSLPFLVLSGHQELEHNTPGRRRCLLFIEVLKQTLLVVGRMIQHCGSACDA